MKLSVLVLSILGDSQQEEIFVSQGQRLELPCNGIHEANATVLWKINGTAVPLSRRRYLQRANLIIDRIDRSQDHGEYYCEVANIGSSNDISVKNDTIFVRVDCK